MLTRNSNEHDRSSGILATGLDENGVNDSVLPGGRGLHKGVGILGRNQLPPSVKSPSLFLGGSPDKTKLVLWQPTRVGSGSSLGLLIDSFGIGVAKMPGSARMLSKLSANTRYNLSCLTAGRCVNYISYIFDAGGNVIFLPEESSVCVKNMLLVMQGVEKLPAASVGPIQFIGGPPGNRQYTRGSLLTLLQDLILLSMCGNQTNRIERLEEALASAK